MTPAAEIAEMSESLAPVHLPRSSLKILAVLNSCSGMCQKDLVIKTKLSPRAVRYALQKLRENHLIFEKMNLQDMRQSIFISRMTLGGNPVPKHWWLARDFVHAKQMMPFDSNSPKAAG